MTDAHAEASICDIDFYSQSTIEDPAIAYSKMLSLGPVVWLSQNNIHAICGYTELVATLRNHECFVSGKGIAVDELVNKRLLVIRLTQILPNMMSCVR